METETKSAAARRYLFVSTDTLRPCVETIIDSHMGGDLQMFMCCGDGKILLYFGSHVDALKKKEIMESLERSINGCEYLLKILHMDIQLDLIQNVFVPHSLHGVIELHSKGLCPAAAAAAI